MIIDPKERKKKGKIVLLMLTVFAMLSFGKETVKAAEVVKENTESEYYIMNECIMYTEADVTSEPIGVIIKGSILSNVGTEENGFIPITYADIQGYVPAGFITTDIEKITPDEEGAVYAYSREHIYELRSYDTFLDGAVLALGDYIGSGIEEECYINIGSSDNILVPTGYLYMANNVSVDTFKIRYVSSEDTVILAIESSEKEDLNNTIDFSFTYKNGELNFTNPDLFKEYDGKITITVLSQNSYDRCMQENKEIDVNAEKNSCSATIDKGGTLKFYSSEEKAEAGKDVITESTESGAATNDNTTESPDEENAINTVLIILLIAAVVLIISYGRENPLFS